jgi:aminoglycoside phosphotransferase family enzyme/predicted kinase
VINDVVLDSARIAVRETHIGAVFLIGDRAYKMKKPVNMRFLDFSTREHRLTACRREVELNRRLAPDVYLGVADVSGVDGELCDHLVVMRRMPESRRLATMVEAGESVRAEVVEIARLMAGFHASATRTREITAEGGRDALLGRWSASFHEVERFRSVVLDDRTLAEIERLTVEFLAGRAELFAERGAAGRVVDGHGDLLADDIFCLSDGPRVLDCLEFDDRLRWVDGVDDIAFLAMDLERLGAPELRDLLLERYREFTGDPAPRALWSHYLAYRAFVRAKVACLRYSQRDRSAIPLAELYAGIALRHLRDGQVRLILVGGLPGTGKTTVAGRVADELGGVLVSSDRLRKELAGISPDRHAPAEYGEGIYQQGHTDRVYAELMHRAERLLALGETVVLDASWHSARHREQARVIAERGHSRLVSLRCEVDAVVAAARMRARDGSISDADAAVSARMATELDPWPEATSVSTAGSPVEAVTRALTRIRDDAHAGDAPLDEAERAGDAR